MRKHPVGTGVDIEHAYRDHRAAYDCTPIVSEVTTHLPFRNSMI